MSVLEIRNLHVNVEGREILKGVNLGIKQGEVHALMGPNGTGKSTLAYTLMGHPHYEATQGEVWFKGQNILELEPDERAHLGLFLAFQYPIAIPGVSVANFLRTAINSQRKSQNPDDKGIPIPEFRRGRIRKRGCCGRCSIRGFASPFLRRGFRPIRPRSPATVFRSRSPRS